MTAPALETPGLGEKRERRHRLLTTVLPGPPMCVSPALSLFKGKLCVENKEPGSFYFCSPGPASYWELTDLSQWPPFGYHIEGCKLDYFPFWKQNKKRKII